MENLVKLNMRILVTGGAGFIGSHVADALTVAGYEVYIYDIVISRYLQGSQKMITGNILDRDLVRETVKGAELVYHFAAMADIAEAKNNPVDSSMFNIMGTMYILDACREFNVRRFLFASTIYVYSDHGSFYRSSKQSCELFIENS